MGLNRVLDTWTLRGRSSAKSDLSHWCGNRFNNKEHCSHKTHLHGFSLGADGAAGVWCWFLGECSDMSTAAHRLELLQRCVWTYMATCIEHLEQLHLSSLKAAADVLSVRELKLIQISFVSVKLSITGTLLIFPVHYLYFINSAVLFEKKYFNKVIFLQAGVKTQLSFSVFLSIYFKVSALFDPSNAICL